MKAHPTSQSIGGLFAAILWLLSAHSSPGTDIVVNGQPRAVIVLPEAASPVVKYAAKELQAHIELATGAQVKITSEQQATEAPGRIYLGPCTAARTCPTMVRPASGCSTLAVFDFIRVPAPAASTITVRSTLPGLESNQRPTDSKSACPCQQSNRGMGPA